MPRKVKLDNIFASLSKKNHFSDHMYSRIRYDEMPMHQENEREDEPDQFSEVLNHEHDLNLEMRDLVEESEIFNAPMNREQSQQENHIQNEAEFKNVVKMWATSCNIHLSHITKLMKELKNKGFIKSSTDARSILSTPKAVY